MCALSTNMEEFMEPDRERHKWYKVHHWHLCSNNRNDPIIWGCEAPVAKVTLYRWPLSWPPDDMAWLVTSTKNSVKDWASHGSVSIHLQNSGTNLSSQVQETSFLLVNLGGGGLGRAPVVVTMPGCSLSMRTFAVDTSFSHVRCLSAAVPGGCIKCRTH